MDPVGKYPGELLTLPVDQPNFIRNNRYHEFGVYFNDSWRIGNRFTLNTGLRWEYYDVQHNTDPALDSNFYYGPGPSYPEKIETTRRRSKPAACSLAQTGYRDDDGEHVVWYERSGE